MLNINPVFYKYYSLVITLFLAAVIYIAFDYYNLNQTLSSKVSELNSKAEKLEDSIRAQVTTRAPEDTMPCQQWIGSNTPMAENEVCFYDGGRDIQTNSDIHIWSYSEKQWIEPVGTGDPEVITIIRTNDTELGLYYPAIIKCPWGCTLGYTE